MPQTVINQVNYLGKDQPEQFIFTDRKGQLISNVDDFHGADDLKTDQEVKPAPVKQVPDTKVEVTPQPTTTPDKTPGV
jgi:hypothetical protein